MINFKSFKSAAQQAIKKLIAIKDNFSSSTPDINVSVKNKSEIDSVPIIDFELLHENKPEVVSVQSHEIVSDNNGLLDNHFSLLNTGLAISEADSEQSANSNDEVPDLITTSGLLHQLIIQNELVENNDNQNNGKSEVHTDEIITIVGSSNETSLISNLVEGGIDRDIEEEPLTHNNQEVICTENEIVEQKINNIIVYHTETSEVGMTVINNALSNYQVGDSLFKSESNNSLKINFESNNTTSEKNKSNVAPSDAKTYIESIIHNHYSSARI